MADLAHISTDHRSQTVAEHLLQVGQETGKRAAKLGLAQAGELIGLLHDLGKATSVFQNYIQNPQTELRGKIDHSTAGAQIIWQRLSHNTTAGALEFASLLALPIVSHHSGLIDCVSPEGEDTLTRRLNKPAQDTRVDEAWRSLDAEVRASIEKLLASPDLIKSLRRACKSALNQETNKEPFDRHHLQLGLMLRMLFSCLIDADRTDTANFESRTASSLRQMSHYLSWSVLHQRLEAHLAGMPTAGEVNRVRREISEICDREGHRPPGTYRLTVPTGGGKTLAALRFALRHAASRAAEQTIDRVIFVSPYISIVEQNAAVARNVLERTDPFATVVLEHHSNLIQEDENESRKHWRRRLLTENWDAPIIFTTMAQVLESLFGAGTRAVRRLHAMAHAVIIFDEAQTLPISVLHLFNNAVNYLVRACGSTVLLCTATQPQLHAVSAEAGALHFSQPEELVEHTPALFLPLRRYIVEDATARRWNHVEVADAACSFAQQRGSCLVVLNTKREVRNVFKLCRERLPEGYVIHLSTAMCPAHRAEQLDALKHQLQQQQNLSASKPDASRPILCVSTNLIEAGVDIDFAAVIRDLAGLDSIAQAAGRCNRHGLRKDPGRVLIVHLPDPPRELTHFLHGRAAALRVLHEWRRQHPSKAFPLDTQEPMERYFHIINHERKEEMSFPINAKSAVREDTLLSMLGRNRKAMADAQTQQRTIPRALLHQSFMAAADCFKLIAPTQGVIVPYGECGKKVINDLAATFDLAAEWQLQRQAQRYTISLYHQAFHQLQKDHAVYELKAESGVYALRSEWYDDELGLREAAAPLEALIG